MTNFIGKPAPNFVAPAIMPDNSLNAEFDLNEHRMGFPCILFFYSLNFSYVCPTEIIAFQNRLTEFKKRKTYVVGVSCDSHLSHLAWKKTPVAEGGIGNVHFPLVSDITRTITSTYDVQINNTVAHRATFLIDPDGYVRYQSIYDSPFGRDVDELLRVVDAFQYHMESGQVCPAGWRPGQPAIEQSEQGTASYLAKNADTL